MKAEKEEKIDRNKSIQPYNQPDLFPLLKYLFKMSHTLVVIFFVFDFLLNVDLMKETHKKRFMGLSVLSKILSSVYF